MERITWTRRIGLGQSGWNGVVGTRRVFTITQSAVRGEGWKLSTLMPIGLLPDKSHGSEADVKAYAERVLRRFVHSFGASFPEDD